ncbi:MAG: hypothetical protein WBM86_32120, partial [Waterburya sp.]
EQYRLGGGGFGGGAIRGYSFQAFRNDNGISGTLQIPWTFLTREKSQLFQATVTPFIDAGGIFQVADSPLSEPTLASTGVQLEFNWRSFSLSMYYGIPLVNVRDEFREPFGLRGGVQLQF